MTDKIKLAVMVRNARTGVVFITSGEFTTEAEALVWANKQVEFWITAEKATPMQNFKLDGTRDSFSALTEDMRLTGNEGKEEFWCGVDTKTRLNWSRRSLHQALADVLERADSLPN